MEEVKNNEITPLAVGTKSFDTNGDAYISGNTYIGKSISIGSGTTASGQGSHAEGYYTQANGSASHAEGYGAIANGGYSHAEGYSTSAIGHDSHAEGQNTKANGDFSHAEGSNTKTSGVAAHAEGYITIAEGIGAHAEGSRCEAHNQGAHAEGHNTRAYNIGEHASGKFNISTSGATATDPNGTLFSVGFGTSDSARNNAIEITQTGVLKANTSWTTGSDRKLKENIEPLGNGVLDKVMKLKPTSFTLKNDKSKRKQIGFIAQEVEEVFPEYVIVSKENDEETRYLDYEKMCSVLCKAIQELKEKLDTLKNK